MAYVTYYTANFSDPLNKRINISFDRKDGNPATVVTNYPLTEHSIFGDADELYSPVISRSTALKLFLEAGSAIDWNTFFDQQHDEWRLTITDDAQHVFTGYLVPDAGTIPFEDKPYELSVKAVDGLALLKNVPLSKPDGTNFKGRFSFIQYIAACLQKTQLNLPIKVYCDIYESSMLDRGDGIQHDMFAQAKLDHRTFLKSPTEFVSCFDALEIILGEHFRLFQDYDLTTDQQVWCINRIPEYQYVPAPIVYYTIYDFDGTNPVGYEDPENYALVGKNELIYKTNEVSMSGKFATKSVRHTYNYRVWPEIPLNNKFSRGALVPLLSGSNYTGWTIDDWEFGQTNGAVDTSAFDYPFVLNATSKRAYRKSTFNIYGIELEREIFIERPATTGRANWLRSEGIPVNVGDKFEARFDVKYMVDIAAISAGVVKPMYVYILGDDSKVYALNQTDTILEWVSSTFTSGVNPHGVIQVDFTNPARDSMKYTSISVDPPIVPANGYLYLAFSFASFPGGTHVSFKNFSFDYHPYVAGGYIEVKGDYFETSQAANYIDVTDKEMHISDTITRVLKGCIFRFDGLTATTPTWNRFGKVETLHYKQLANQGRFNTEYRRFYKFEGTFTSTKFSPQNDPTLLQPLSFRKKYRFVDLPQQPECVLVAPLTIDYKTGWITATFEEVRRDSGTAIVETMGELLTRIVTEINSTTEAEWDSANLAPASGTTAFPPFASVWPYAPNTVSITINSTNEVTTAYMVGSAGNTPSITKTFDQVVSPGQRLFLFQIGTDIAIGNTFIFTAYGHDVGIVVQAGGNGSNDGIQTGDSSTFNYLFE